MALLLKTTDTQLHDLWAVANAKRRAATTRVAVDHEALCNLLKDHHTLYSAATGTVMRGGKGHTVEAGADQGSMR
jgi:hypothetical protein